MVASLYNNIAAQFIFVRYVHIHSILNIQNSFFMYTYSACPCVGSCQTERQKWNSMRVLEAPKNCVQLEHRVYLRNAILKFNFKNEYQFFFARYARVIIFFTSFKSAVSFTYNQLTFFWVLVVLKNPWIIPCLHTSMTAVLGFKTQVISA